MSITVSSMTSVRVTEDGRITIQKQYVDGRLEFLTFDDAYDLEQFIDDVGDLTETRTCPKCGQSMQVNFVKEYDCDDCCTVYSDDVLDVWNSMNDK